MTLDLAKFISNSIRTQAKIQHFDVNTKTVSTEDIPKSVTDIIYEEYGEKYLDDADFVSFFWGAITKDDIKKLFNVVDKALGKSANKLTDTDFKKITIGSSDETEEIIDDEIEIEEVDDDNEDEKMNENEDEDEVETEDEEETEEKEVEIVKNPSHFFLKITLK